MFDYKAKVTIRPEVLKPGVTAEGTAVFTDVTDGPVDKAFASITDIGRIELAKVSENVFGLRYTIPFFVPPGTYDAWIFGVSPKGEKGPRVQVKLRVSR